MLIPAAIAGKLISKIKLPAILGWLIVGMLLGPHAAGLLPQAALDEKWYQLIIMWMQCAFGLMLGAPLNYHLILGAGLYTFLYIGSRGLGKYFGARLGAKATKMPKSVQKYLGLTLLPHSGVSLVFTGIACTSLASKPELAGIVQGTIAAAAVINEIIAVIAAKKGFQYAGEIGDK